MIASLISNCGNALALTTLDRAYPWLSRGKPVSKEPFAGSSRPYIGPELIHSI